MEVQIYCIILIIPLMLTVQINNLKFLAPFSALSNIFLITVCGISFYYIFEDFPSLETRNMHPTFSQLPLFLRFIFIHFNFTYINYQLQFNSFQYCNICNGRYMRCNAH